MLAIYIVAMIATCWHFSYGIWLFAAKWGITPGDRARHRFGQLCAAFGSGLCILGLASIYAFVGNPEVRQRPRRRLRPNITNRHHPTRSRHSTGSIGRIMPAPRIIVIGGGLAGLSAVIKIAEAGGTVDLFSIVPVKRSHSVCAQGGINAAKDLKGEGDTVLKHFDDTVYGGDFLADQAPVRDMTARAPAIIDLLDRMGVPFNRTHEGLLDFRRFGGTLYQRTAFAGATTGQQLLYALDEQVRRHEAEGKVTKYEGWEFLSSVLDANGVCRGICALNLRTMETRTFPADAIIVATGGIGAIFGKSTNSVVCTGSAQSALYQQGAIYANGEFIQVHPTCIPGDDKLRLMSESARGEGGRVWVPRDKQRQARSAQHSRSRPLLLPRGVVSQVRQPRPPRHRYPRHPPRRLRTGPRPGRPAHGLPRSNSH